MFYSLIKKRESNSKEGKNIAELFTLTLNVAKKGRQVLFGNSYLGIFDGVEYYVNSSIHDSLEDVSISTNSFGVRFIRESIGKLRFKNNYKLEIWKGEIPDNLEDILKQLIDVPNKEENY